MSDRIKSLFATPAEIEAQREKDRAARRTIQGLFAARPTPPAATATEPAPAEPATETATEEELAPPAPAASTPEPAGAQAQEVQLLFDNNQIYTAYHGVVPGKTIDDLKALFSTDEEREAFAVGAATYLESPVWYGLFGFDKSWMTYDGACCEAESLEEEGLIKGLQAIPTFCHDMASAKKLKANYECVLAFCPELTTVLTFKMDEAKKVRAAFVDADPTIPLAWRCAAADALAPTTPRSLANKALRANDGDIVNAIMELIHDAKTATLAERDERIASLEKELKETRKIGDEMVRLLQLQTQVIQEAIQQGSLAPLEREYPSA